MEGRGQPPDDPDPDGPWDPPSRRPLGRFLRRLAVLVMVGLLLLVGLETAAPPVAGRAAADGTLVRYILFGAIIIFALAASRRSLAAIGGQVAVWLGAILLVVVGYSYRDEIRVVARHDAADLVPAQGRVVGDRAIAFAVSADRQYWVDATVDGKPLHFLIDTGASGVVLNRRDAERLGFAASDLAFTQTFSTANGQTRGAPVLLRELRIGPIAMQDVPASVNEGDLDQSLLGMHFLERLAEVTIRDGVLTIRQ